MTRATLASSSDPSVIDLIAEDLGVTGRAPVSSPDGGSMAYIRADGMYVADVRGLDW